MDTRHSISWSFVKWFHVHQRMLNQRDIVVSSIEKVYQAPIDDLDTASKSLESSHKLYANYFDMERNFFKEYQDAVRRTFLHTSKDHNV